MDVITTIRQRIMEVNSDINPEHIKVYISEVSRYFNIEGKAIKRLSYLQELKTYYKLNIQRTQIEKLPDTIGEHILLQKLILCHNKLKTIPEKIGDLKNLKILNLSNNELTGIPEKIGNLKELEEIYISNNKLKTLPKTIGGLHKLKKIYITNNEIRRIPNTIGDIEALESLSLENNNLINLPETIGNLDNLKFLYLAKNKLTYIPECIGKCRKLTSIYLNDNQLKTMPESFECIIDNIIFFDISNNPIEKLYKKMIYMLKYDNNGYYIEHENGKRRVIQERKLKIIAIRVMNKNDNIKNLPNDLKRIIMEKSIKDEFYIC